MPQFLGRYDVLQNISIMGEGKHDFFQTLPGTPPMTRFIMHSVSVVYSAAFSLVRHTAKISPL